MEDFSDQVIRPVCTEWADSKNITIVDIRWGRRRITPIHGPYLAGRYPLGGGRGTVPYESWLERRVIAWLAAQAGLKALVAQPVTVHARIGDRSFVYTPDLLCQFEEIPPALRPLGFGRDTFVEVTGQPKSRRHQMRVAVLAIAFAWPLLIVKGKADSFSGCGGIHTRVLP